MTADAPDPRITAAVDAIAQAIRRFLLKCVHVTEDEDQDAAEEDHAAAEQELAEAIRQAVVGLADDPSQETVVGVLQSLVGPLIEVDPLGKDQAVGEAEGIVRNANMARLHEQFDSGERQLVWPPSPGVEWDELRVMVAQFMERRRADWPEIAFADKPLMGTYSPFNSAVQGAQFFLAFWLKAKSREDLLRERVGLNEVHVAAWERYLELPPKS